MNNSNELINRINEKYSSMSKGQKLLSTYITDNYDKAVFLTAEKLGKVVGESVNPRLCGLRHILGIVDILNFRKHWKNWCVIN